jgi:ElaB/YqjD/DUF883 family membrane-anchored ribosome-binding protein
MENPEITPVSSSGNGATNAWDHRVDKFRSVAHARIDRLSESARPAVDQWSASAHQTVDKLSSGAAQAAAVLSEKFGQLRDSQQQVLSNTRERIREKPMLAVGIAVAAGFLLRQLFRSRR